MVLALRKSRVFPTPHAGQRRGPPRRRATPKEPAMNDPLPPKAPTGKRQELRAFLTLAVCMGPVLAVLLVSGFGFLVWMLQLVAGPPGPRL